MMISMNDNFIGRDDDTSQPMLTVGIYIAIQLPPPSFSNHLFSTKSVALKFSDLFQISIRHIFGQISYPYDMYHFLIKRYLCYC